MFRKERACSNHVDGTNKLNLSKEKLNFSCIYCRKELNTTLTGSASHARHCEPYRVANNLGEKKPINYRSWNKGLTKHTSESVRKSGETFSKRIKDGIIIPSFTNKSHSEESKLKISKKLSVNQKGGRCKWYIFEGQSLQGTWELEIAKKLSEAKIDWKRVKLYTDSFEYTLENKTRTYTPDFYIKEIDSYLEVKGYWWGNDKLKMEEVIKSYPNKKFIIIETTLYKELISLTQDKFKDKLYSLK